MCRGTPKWDSHTNYHAGRKIAKKLIDHGRLDELNDLAKTSLKRKNFYLILAITYELKIIHELPPSEVITPMVHWLLNRKPLLNLDEGQINKNHITLDSIVAIVIAAIGCNFADKKVLANLIEMYLPETPHPNIFESNYNSPEVLSAYFTTYTLMFACKGQDLTCLDLAPDKLKDEILKKEAAYNISSEARTFQYTMSMLLPWFKMLANEILLKSPKEELINQINLAIEESNRASNAFYSKDIFNVTNTLAIVWFNILTIHELDRPLLDQFNQYIRGKKYGLSVLTYIRIIKYCVFNNTFKDIAFEFCTFCFNIIDNSRDLVETNIDLYLALSRAIMPLDKAESKIIFDTALNKANYPSYNSVIDYWVGSLDLAQASINEGAPSPKLSYLIARAAEVIKNNYIERDKHFPWQRTVKTIIGLCPSSGIATMSRWSDRRFGVHRNLIAIFIRQLLRHDRISPQLASSFICFEDEWGEWNIASFIEEILSKCSSQVLKQNTLDFLLSYISLNPQSDKVWDEIAIISSKHALSISNISSIIDSSKARSLQKHVLTYDVIDGSKAIAPQVGVIFEQLDIATIDGLEEAWQRFRSLDEPFSAEKFFHGAIGHLQLGQEINFIKAVQECAFIDYYFFHIFLQVIPDSWLQRRAIQSTMTDCIKYAFKKYASDIFIDAEGWYEPLPLDLCSRLSDVPVSELAEITLNELSNVSNMMSSGRLFKLCSLLATQLEPAGANEALLYGLNLFEDNINEGDSDGVWREELAVADDTSYAIAGYLWSALAAPETAVRWQAAHTIKAICDLNCDDVLKHLLSFLKNNKFEVFCDGRLFFYHYHSVQWLLFALERASQGKVFEELKNYSDLFLEIVDTSDHPLIRKSTANILLNIYGSSIEESLGGRLININTPLNGVKEVPWHFPNARELNKTSYRYHFNIDINAYWFPRLANCFNCPDQLIAEEVEKIICDEWNNSIQRGYEIDQRHKLGLFPRESWRHSHGSYPICHDLDFYLSYNALMITAGRFAKKFEVYKDKEGDIFLNRFEEWISRHDLSRNDRRWLSDRRDVFQVSFPSWNVSEIDRENWPYTVTKKDFDHYLNIDHDHFLICGYMTFKSSTYRENIHINSWLIDSDLSRDLTEKWQNAEYPNEYYGPSVGDHFNNSNLIAWIASSAESNGADELDPWGRDIRFPPYRPAPFISDKFNLITDVDSRCWYMQEKITAPVLISKIWRGKIALDEHEPIDYGHYLKIKKDFLSEMLSTQKQDLIISIEIKRDISNRSYNHDEIYLLPSFRIFSIKFDGTIFSV